MDHPCCEAVHSSPGQETPHKLDVSSDYDTRTVDKDSPEGPHDAHCCEDDKCKCDGQFDLTDP